jgi:hypothetical protein
MIKTVVKVRGSTNSILNKYSINSFYESDDLSLLAHYKLLTWSY